MANHKLDGAIEALARRQHGAFSIQQVHRLGGDRFLARRRANTGQWIRLDQGVYALPGNPSSVLRQMKAAELAVPGAAVSGSAAAMLHALPGIRLGRIEISTGRNGGDTPLATVRHRLPVPTTRVEGIRVTTIAQTVADLAGRTESSILQDVLDEALLTRSVSWVEVHEVWQLARRRRSPSALPLGRLLAGRDPTRAVASSVLEARLYALLDDPRLPPFLRQAAAPWATQSGERVDALFPAERWIVEGDGRAWHARVADFERDRVRDHRAQRIGYGVSRFTSSQIAETGYVIETLLAAFDHRNRRAA